MCCNGKDVGSNPAATRNENIQIKNFFQIYLDFKITQRRVKIGISKRFVKVPQESHIWTGMHFVLKTKCKSVQSRPID